MPCRSQILQRFAAHAAQVGAAQVHQGVAPERIELEIDFEPALALGELRDEIGLLRDADAVGVDHGVADRPPPHRIEDGEELGMQGRLAARQLHQVRLAFARHQRVEHPLDRRERQVRGLLRRGIGEAHRAGEIAVLVDLDQRQAGMLLVVGTEPAVERAAVFGAALPGERAIARLEIVLAGEPVGRVGRHQGRLHAVARAALLVPDLVVLDDDLGRHQAEAGLAQGRGLAPEDVGANLTQGRVHRGIRSKIAWRCNWPWARRGPSTHSGGSVRMASLSGRAAARCHASPLPSSSPEGSGSTVFRNSPTAAGRLFTSRTMAAIVGAAFAASKSS